MEGDPSDLKTQYVVYGFSMTVFEDPESPDILVRTALRGLLPYILGPNADRVLEAYNFWVTAYESVFAIGVGPEARVALKDLVRKYLVNDHPYIQSPYNVAQGAMKATIHLMWKRHYSIVVYAIGAVGCIQQRVAAFRLFLDEITREKGMTAEQFIEELDAADHC
jgi:hypothetical protein